MVVGCSLFWWWWKTLQIFQRHWETAVKMCNVQSWVWPKLEILRESGPKLMTLRESGPKLTTLRESGVLVSQRCFMLTTDGAAFLWKDLAPLLKPERNHNRFDPALNFMKPSLPCSTHQSFQKETEFLTIFPNGAACCMMHMNSDCWYLCTLGFPEG